MNPLIAIACVIVILLLLIFLLRRRSTQTPTRDTSKLPRPDSPYIKVYVSKSGAIALDGKLASIDEVERAFAFLAQKQGVILYNRQDPGDAEPHPNAVQVIKLVTQNRLTIRLCVAQDCSDALDAHGKLKVEA